jgi:heat shock protein HtpX
MRHGTVPWVSERLEAEERRLRHLLAHSAVGFAAAASVLPALGVLLGVLHVGEVGPDAAAGAALAAVAGGFALWRATEGVLRGLGAEPAPSAVARRLGPILEALAGRAGIPVPGLWILRVEEPNAFAVSGPGGPRIGVTTGLLDRLDEDEVAAVLAHEVAHLEHRDPWYLGWFLAVATLLVGLTAVSVGAALGAAVASRSGGRRRGDDDASAAIALAAVLGALAALAVGAAGLLVVRVAALAGLRGREYAADARGALLCGRPRALASALRRLEAGRQGRIRVAPAATSLFTVSPVRAAPWWQRLFATHPPTAERVRRLEALHARVGDLLAPTGSARRRVRVVPARRTRAFRWGEASWLAPAGDASWFAVRVESEIRSAERARRAVRPFGPDCDEVLLRYLRALRRVRRALPALVAAGRHAPIAAALDGMIARGDGALGVHVAALRYRDRVRGPWAGDPWAATAELRERLAPLWEVVAVAEAALDALGRSAKPEPWYRDHLPRGGA